MKLTINKTCYETQIRLSDNGIDIPLGIETKKFIIRKVLDTIVDEDILDWMVKDCAPLLDTITKEEYHRCGQCGDDNYYQEFEI